MSTYWYFECQDHYPPLQSDDEFTQHTDDAWFKQGVEMARNRPVPKDEGEYWLGRFPNDRERSRQYFQMNARKFLHLHPNCRIGLVNEYGERKELEEA